MRTRTGARVAMGSLRVDPRRALEKLREYQLADPAGWALEVIRSAVGFGAARVEVRGDADDVWVAFAGEPPAAELLVDLFGELLSASHGRAGRARRLLATGVNSALGADPRFVDVYRCTTDATERFRYDPALLRSASPDDPAPVRPHRSFVAVDPALPRPGLAVHLKRTFREGLVAWFSRAEPPELAAVRDACTDLGVPITVGGEALGAGALGPDLFALPLGEGLRGFVAVTDPLHRLPARGGVLDAAELGVTMARIPFEPAEPPTRRGLPLRVFLDAERLPANASRSDLRRDEAPLPEAIARADALVPPLLAGFAEALEAMEEGPRRSRMRASALELLGATIGGTGWEERVVRGATPVVLFPLLRLPLVRDALGRPRTVAELARTAHRGVVHEGREALGRELEPWLGDVLWAPPGDDARRLLAGEPCVPIDRLLTEATQGLEARAGFLAHAPVGGSVPEAPDQWLAVRIEAPPVGLAARLEEVADGPRGEVVILDPRSRRPGLVLTVLVQSRPIERIEIPAPIPLDAVVECDDLVPRPDYRGVVHDAALRNARRRTVMAALSALEAAAALLDAGAGTEGVEGASRRADLPDLAEERPRRAFEGFVRRAASAALGLFAAYVTRGNPEKRAREALMSDEARLSGAPAWPSVVDGHDAMLGLRAIAARAHDPIVVGRADDPQGFMPSGGFFGVRLDEHDTLTLTRALDDQRVVHAYDGRRAAWSDAPGRRLLARLARPGTVARLVEQQDRRAVVAWGAGESALEIHHRGVLLERRPFEPSFVPCVVAVDHDGVVPTTRWDAVLAGPSPAFDPRPLEAAMIEAVAAVRLGHPLDRASDGAPDASPELRIADDAGAALADRGLLLALARGASLTGALVAALRARPMVPRLPPHAAVSLDELAAGHGEPLLHVDPGEAAIDFDPGEFAPIVADPELAIALGALTSREPSAAGARLPLLASAARRASRRAALLRRPVGPLEVSDLDLEVDASHPHGPGRLGLASRAPFTGLAVEVRLEGRPVLRMEDPNGPPLRGYVAVAEGELEDGFDTLTPAGDSRLADELAMQARALLRAMLERAPDSAMRSAAARALASHFLDTQGEAKSERALEKALRDELLLPGLRGEATTVKAATADGHVLLCRYADEWLGPSSAAHAPEPLHRLDGPVLLFPEREPGSPLELLARRLAEPRPVEDVTTEARDLQTRRRIARGRLEAPRTDAPDRRLAFALAQLGEDAPEVALLGVGEVALMPGDETVVALYELGARRTVVRFPRSPAIAIAVEAPALIAELDASGALSKAASTKVERLIPVLRQELARRVLRALPDELAPWARAALRSIALAGAPKDDDAALRARPLFETTDGRLLSLAELASLAKPDDPLWATPDAGATDRPLDEARPVLRLALADIEALARRVPTIDARARLARDRAERAFLGRPEVDPCAPADASAVASLGAIVLEGERSRRGLVKALLPSSGTARGLVVFHRGRRLAELPDTADWPGRAWIEDPALVPSSGFDGVEGGPAIEKLQKAVRDAVEKAIEAALPEATPDALVALTVARKVGGSMQRDGGAVRGTVWLDERPGSGGLTVIDARGERELSFAMVGRPDGRSWPVALRGRVFAVRDGASKADRVDAVARAAYGALVRRLLREHVAADRAPSEGALGHLVRAIAVGALSVKRVELEAIALPCLVPAPASLADVRPMLSKGDPVIVARPDELEALGSSPSKRTLLDDGSPASAVLLDHLGSRVERPYARWRRLFGFGASVTSAAEPRTRDAGSTERLEPKGAAQGERTAHGAPARKPRRAARAPHPVDPIARALLGLLGRVGLGGKHLAGVRVDADRTSPRVAYDASSRKLVLAGGDPILRALAPAFEHRGEVAEEALVALAAHCAGVLNRALVPVTDATESAALVALLDRLADHDTERPEPHGAS